MAVHTEEVDCPKCEGVGAFYFADTANDSITCELCEGEGTIKEDKYILSYDGALDDVFISCDYFRMEQMSSGCWWIAVHKKDKRICFFLNSKKKITATISEDEIGCEYENINSKTGQRIIPDSM